MQYDFTIRPNRSGKGSEKWDEMYERNPLIGNGIVPLSVADMEFPNPPEIKEALADYLKDAVLGYTEATDSLWDAVLGWQTRMHGWTPTKESAILSPGVVPAIFVAVQGFTEPGDGVIIQPPVYYPFRKSIERNARRVVNNPLKIVTLEDGTHRYEIDFADLAEKAADPKNKLLILCSPHNPVGRVWTADELRRLLDICIGNDVMVVCDEIHDDLIMPGYHHTAIMNVAEAGEYDHLIVCTAPSKTFNIAGCQGSCIYVPDEENCAKMHESFNRNAIGDELNTFAYTAMEAAYTRCDEWLKELLEVIAKNYQYLCGAISKTLPGVEVYPMEGTYLAWLDFRSWGLNPEELSRFMVEDALCVFDEGNVFGKEGAGFERINLACPTEVLEEALERLVQAANDRGFGRANA